jgi:hypothetical protein
VKSSVRRSASTALAVASSSPSVKHTQRFVAHSKAARVQILAAFLRLADRLRPP